MHIVFRQNGLALKVEKSREQMMVRKNMAKKIHGVKKVIYHPVGYSHRFEFK